MTGRQQETSDSVCHRKLTDRLSKSLADDTHPLRTEFDSRLIDRSGRLKYPSQKQHALSSHSFREPYRHSTSHMTGTYCQWPSADSLSRPFCWQYALTVCDHQQTQSPVLSADSMHLLSVTISRLTLLSFLLTVCTSLLSVTISRLTLPSLLLTVCTCSARGRERGVVQGGGWGSNVRQLCDTDINDLIWGRVSILLRFASAICFEILK